jgi:hypothetical protein
MSAVRPTEAESPAFRARRLDYEVQPGGSSVADFAPPAAVRFVFCDGHGGECRALHGGFFVMFHRHVLKRGSALGYYGAPQIFSGGRAQTALHSIKTRS